MKIQYTENTFHGYNATGEPFLCAEHEAETFSSEREAMEMVSHDGEQFGFWEGSFKLV
jgi:hypothetical protein